MPQAYPRAGRTAGFESVICGLLIHGNRFGRRLDAKGRGGGRLRLSGRAEVGVGGRVYWGFGMWLIGCIQGVCRCTEVGVGTWVCRDGCG